MKKPVILSTLNHKGGVGKTILTFNLACYFEFIFKKNKLNKKILIIDNDPQGSCSELLHTDFHNLKEEETLAEIYRPEANYTDKIIHKKEGYDKIYYVPSIHYIEFMKDILPAKISGMLRLQKFILQHCQDFDIILIDSSPAFSILSKNALFVTDYIIIPVIPDTFSVTGIKQIFTNIEQIREVNPLIDILGLAINKVNDVKNNNKTMRYIMYRYFETDILNSVIHEAAVIEESVSFRKALLEVTKKERAHKQFLDLASEILDKLGFNVKYDSKKAASWRNSEIEKLREEYIKKVGVDLEV